MPSISYLLRNLALLTFSLLAASSKAWTVVSVGRQGARQIRVAATNGDNDPKGGYKFGDFTRSIGRRVTGDKDYQIGDISRKLDQLAKSRVNELTGNKEYKFGDFSRWADSQIKEKVANYTGKSNYEVGDISKAVVRRVSAGDYDLEDVILMIRVVLQMGASFTPMARLLPVKLLLEILNVGLAQDVGSKVVGKVAMTLDERFKQAITGDSNYKLGDKSKEQLAKSLSAFTGKDTYSFGDISQAVAQRLAETEKEEVRESNGSNSISRSSRTEALLELMNNEALAEWDKKLLETEASKGNSNKK